MPWMLNFDDLPTSQAGPVEYSRNDAGSTFFESLGSDDLLLFFSPCSSKGIVAFNRHVMWLGRKAPCIDYLYAELLARLHRIGYESSKRAKDGDARPKGLPSMRESRDAPSIYSPRLKIRNIWLAHFHLA